MFRFIDILAYIFKQLIITVIATVVLTIGLTLLGAGVIGTGMCLDIEYYGPLWAFILYIIIGSMIFIGALLVLAKINGDD